MKSAALKSVFLFGLNFLQSCNIVRLLRFEKRLATVQVKKADTAYYPYTFNDNRMYVIGQVQAGEKKDSLIFSFDR